MKRLNFNIKDRKVLYGILTIALACVFSLTIVYAALSVTLNIQGNAEVVASTWDIHLDNVKVTSGSVSGTDPSVTSPTTATFSTTLNMPGEFYEFTIDVVNDGSIDAMIDSVTKEPTLTETQAKYLNYIIEYQNGESISTKQLVAKNSFVRLKVRVEFRSDITASDLPTTTETLNLSFTVNYVQSDGTESNVTDNGVYKIVKVMSGDYDTIGSEICIKEECFYVISSTEDNVTMLARMNITLDDNPIQSTNAGETKYSNTDFNYSGSLVEGYVNNYKNVLEKTGVSIQNARLITYEELNNPDTFACDYGSFCSDTYPWIYSTRYWTSSIEDVGSAGGLWYVCESYLCSTSDMEILEDGPPSVYGGVRPVIVISKSYF